MRVDCFLVRLVRPVRCSGLHCVHAGITRQQYIVLLACGGVAVIGLDAGVHHCYVITAGVIFTAGTTVNAATGARAAVIVLPDLPFPCLTHLLSWGSI